MNSVRNQSPRNKVESRARSQFTGRFIAYFVPLSHFPALFHLIRRASTSRGASCCPAKRRAAHPSPSPAPSSQTFLSHLSPASSYVLSSSNRMADKTGVRECVSGMMHGGRGTEEGGTQEGKTKSTMANEREEGGGGRKIEREREGRRAREGERTKTVFSRGRGGTSYGNEEMQW